MAEVVGWITIAVLALGGLGVLDVTIRVEDHVAGVKTVCVRGAEARNGQ
jgi:hypothetical protein